MKKIFFYIEFWFFVLIGKYDLHSFNWSTPVLKKQKIFTKHKHLKTIKTKIERPVFYCKKCGQVYNKTKNIYDSLPISYKICKKTI